MENNDIETKSASSGNAKLYAILSYFGILWLLGLLIEPEKNDPYVKNHVNNGIILCIAGVASGIIGVIPVIGVFIAGILSVVILVFAIMGIIAAASDKEFTMPLIGDKLQIIK